jgi:hypothetical protein
MRTLKIKMSVTVSSVGKAVEPGPDTANVNYDKAQAVDRVEIAPQSSDASERLRMERTFAHQSCHRGLYPRSYRQGHLICAFIGAWLPGLLTSDVRWRLTFVVA